jgi:hypothetical protein
MRIATRALLALLLTLALTAPLALAAEQIAWSGRTLEEALELLRDRGLDVFYTTSVVRPEMRVELEPASSEPRQILAELLAAHGLAIREGSGGTLVVVPGDDPAALRTGGVEGVVRARDGAPVAGARVRVLETGTEVETDRGGRFSLTLPLSGLFTLEVRRTGFVVARSTGIAAAAVALTIVLDPAPVMEEELLVTPSRISILREEPVAQLDLSRDEINALPHLGNDFFRALSLLPGISANDVSAQFHVRGGRRDETRVLLDGQELYEVYHLQDFDNALSVIAPEAVENVDLSTGGFPAEHGDRMSGVLDMTTLSPSGPARGQFGVGLWSIEAGGAGGFRDQKGAWLAQLRRGSIDLTGRLLGDEDPQYWDAFGKLDYSLAPRHSVRGNLLLADDKLDFEEALKDESKRISTDYRSSYLWGTHQWLVSSDVFVETALSGTRIDRDRRGIELEEDVQFAVNDQRQLDVLALRQMWNAAPSSGHFLKWGFETRRFDIGYDYLGLSTFDNPLAEIRDGGTETRTEFVSDFEETHHSLHASDRWRILDSLTAELGLRYDAHSQTDESHVSPRFNLSYGATPKNLFRVAWGFFNQSQRPYELQVEDGETEFFPVERSEHRVVGYEGRFGPPDRGVILRAEVYRREVDNPRPRFENLYEALNTFPEVEPDRIRIAPERSVAEGIEIFLRGRIGRRAAWWVNYTWSSTEDVIDGTRHPRSFDQPHALNLDLDYLIGRHWRVNFAWRYHTGWPTTSLTLREVTEEPEEDDEEPETIFVPELGPLFGERLPDYHRLDFRATREWETGFGRVVFLLDLQNVYDRGNIAGFDYDIDEEEGTIDPQPEEWAGFLPSVGVRIEF